MSLRSSLVVGSLLFAFWATTAQAATRPMLDGDADGVSDEVDRCPYTPPGIAVGADGCSTPGDEDEDGIADASDACPYSPVGAWVDEQGCALDDDLDGVADGVDRCARSILGALVSAEGCAPGQVPGPVVARVARPVQRPAPAAVRPAPSPAPERTGATGPVPPAASPATVPEAAPPAAVVSTEAAPVAERVAESPAVPAVASSAEVERTFYFDGRESTLSWSTARAVRKSARELAKKLEQDPAAVVALSGHGDIKSDGMSAAQFASARVLAVRDTLVANGVPAQRINVRVPGVNEPRFSGEELARNCRVELRLKERQALAAGKAAPTAVSRQAVTVPSAAPAPVPMQTVAGTSRVSLNFAPYSALLDAAAMKALDDFAQNATRPLLADTTARVLVVSGIDAGETGRAAQRLAESRAASVRAYLVSVGIPRQRIGVSTQSRTAARRADLGIVAP